MKLWICKTISKAWKTSLFKSIIGPPNIQEHYTNDESGQINPKLHILWNIKYLLWNIKHLFMWQCVSGGFLRVTMLKCHFLWLSWFEFWFVSPPSFKFKTGSFLSKEEQVIYLWPVILWARTWTPSSTVNHDNWQLGFSME